MIGFWCKTSIELIWVEKYEKMGESHQFWSFPKTCTGTEQIFTGTGWVLVVFGQPVPVQVRNRCGTPCSILTSVHILAITCSFLIRFK